MCAYFALLIMIHFLFKKYGAYKTQCVIQLVSAQEGKCQVHNY